MQGRADIQARRLKLKELMPDVELMQKTLEMNGDAELRGSGNSVARFRQQWRQPETVDE